MRTVKAITPGSRFGRLCALENSEFRIEGSGRRRRFHECLCDCGKKRFVSIYALLAGTTKSCGCLQPEVAGKINLSHGYARKVGRKAQPRVYRIWSCMISRCKNPNTTRWHRYGGRGITVCDRWLNFSNFLEDMGEPPTGYSIDRLNNDLGYFKENCAWASSSQQARNRSNVTPISYQGLSLFLIDWAAKLQIPYRTLVERRTSGWSIEDTLSTPHRTKRKKNIDTKKTV